MLSGSYFVVLGLCEYAQFPKLHIEIRHIFDDSLFYRAEIVVFKFLSLGSRRAVESATCVYEVFSFLVHALVNKKIFLFRSHCGYYLLDVLAKEFEYSASRLAQSLH